MHFKMVVCKWLYKYRYQHFVFKFASWPTKPKILTIWPFKQSCWPYSRCYYFQNLQPFHSLNFKQVMLWSPLPVYSRTLTPQTLSFHQDHPSIEATMISKGLTCLLQDAHLINICWWMIWVSIFTSYQSSNSSQEPHCLGSAGLDHSLVCTFSFLLPSPQRNMPALICSL